MYRNSIFKANKAAVLAKIARYTRARAAARHFGVHNKNCQRWLKEELDKKKPRDMPSCGHRKGQGRKVFYPKEIEEELVKWILEKREQSHIAVSTRMIRLKAMSLVKLTLPNFKASECWVRKFLVRNDLVLRVRTSIAQTLPSDIEHKVSQFYQNVTFI